MFDPSTGTFTTLLGSMITARYEAVAAPLPDGRVLIAGGTNGTRFVGNRHKRGWGYGLKVVAYQSPNRLGLINLNGTIVAPRPNRPWRPGS